MLKHHLMEWGISPEHRGFIEIKYKLPGSEFYESSIAVEC